MQRFFGLHPSGELDKETLAVMKRPRCGLSDVEQFGGTIRWKKRTLSYRSAMIRICMAISYIIVNTFHSKSLMSTSWWCWRKSHQEHQRKSPKSLEFNVPVYPVAVKIFLRIAWVKPLTFWWHKMKSQQIIIVIGTRNLYTKFHRNLFNNCQNILV